MDFVHDQLVTGQKLRVLTIVDTYSRYVPALDPRFSYRGEDVVRTLERVCADMGKPKTIRVDQGSEFISRELDLWAEPTSRLHQRQLVECRRKGTRTASRWTSVGPASQPTRML